MYRINKMSDVCWTLEKQVQKKNGSYRWTTDSYYGKPEDLMHGLLTRLPSPELDSDLRTQIQQMQETLNQMVEDASFILAPYMEE